MAKRTFEDFLKDFHSNLYPMVLDDNLPDHFDDWLGTIDGEDYIRWADIFAQEQFLAGMDHVMKQIK